MGKVHVVKVADSDLPRGINLKKTQSVKGEGSHQPDESMQMTLPDGVIVPIGKPVKDKKYDGSLLYNEFIVYQKNQQKARYILR